MSKSMTVRLLIAIGLSASTAVAAAQSSRPTRAPGQPGVVGRHTQIDARAVTMQRLMKPITIELTESRLEDVVKFLEDFSGATIEPYWIDDKYATGLDPDREISVTATDVSVLALIERVLDKADVDDFDRSGWQFNPSGALEIGPRSRLNRRSFLEVYDIRDLLITLPDFTQVPALDLDTVLQQSQQGGGGGSTQSPFQDSDLDDLDQLFPPLNEEQAQELIDIIVTFVEPTQWEDNGGSGGTIRYWRGNLLIRAPDYIHRQLRGYPWWTNNPAVGVAVSRESGITLAKQEVKDADAGQAGQTPRAEGQPGSTGAGGDAGQRDQPNQDAGRGQPSRGG